MGAGRPDRGDRAVSRLREFLLPRFGKLSESNSRRTSVIEAGKKAPGFSLKDQFQREVSLAQFNGRRHVLLLFYPLDYTPT
jgi:hypothetical protein